ncbi:MAG: Rab family GTPase [Candidatus Thorarchaeota archaeon]
MNLLYFDRGATVSDPDFVYKFVFLGDSGVGKTSLVQRYVYDSMDPDIGRTIGAILHVKTVRLDDTHYKLICWDIAGQESFRQMRMQYCANASGAFFVFDRTRPETLGSIDGWLESLYSSTGKVPVVVLENKIDLDPAVSMEDVKREIEKRGLRFVQTSATEGRNVNQAFEELVRSARSRKS